MRVIIGHRDGREYSVTEADYQRLYADEGFTILRNEDGTKHAGKARAEKKTEAKKA